MPQDELLRMMKEHVTVRVKGQRTYYGHEFNDVTVEVEVIYTDPQTLKEHVVWTGLRWF